MGEFTLDTSGEVAFPAIITRTGEPDSIALSYRWSDLSPFTQGYVEAAMREWFASVGRYLSGGAVCWDWLAPETLALILKDCAKWSEGARPPLTAEDGRAHWSARQEGMAIAHPNLRKLARDTFPPLTANLGDDGKVYLREGQS